LTAHEINFDGIVGPTHNYAGLSYGNVASMTHKSSVSSPKRAALEGLAKMKFLMDLGLKQAVLPPHERPHLPTLRARGFTGSDAQILEKVHHDDPRLLAAVSSASAMWAANAATVSPSADTGDRRVHFTPANLVSNLHRSIEAPTTTRVLRTIFTDEKQFVVHDPLPRDLPDEGAANHMRLCAGHGDPGLEIFVFGRTSDSATTAPLKYPARQSLQSSQAIARNHLLDPDDVLFVQQSPAAIDAGAFHNDVIALANQHLMLYLEDAFADPDVWQQIANACPHQDGIYLSSPDVTLADAVASYLFNSQLVTVPDESMALIAPVECQNLPNVRGFIKSIVDGDPIASVHYVDVRQSMRNGGGPACLRLRVVLTDEQIAAMRGNVMLTAALHNQLKAWIEKYYRDELGPDDLRDPKLLEESRAALDELTQILQLGNLYEFQQT
jgi:succinylarginine dihydrolase